MQHHRLRRSVDVGIEHADLRTLGGEPEGEVHGDGRLAYAALPARDRDDVLHARDQLNAPLDGVRGDLVSNRYIHSAHAWK